jgi:hypothetical protein
MNHNKETYISVPVSSSCTCSTRTNSSYVRQSALCLSSLREKWIILLLRMRRKGRSTVCHCWLIQSTATCNITATNCMTAQTGLQDQWRPDSEHKYSSIRVQCRATLSILKLSSLMLRSVLDLILIYCRAVLRPVTSDHFRKDLY